MIDLAMDVILGMLGALLVYGAYAWLRWAWRELREEATDDDR